MRTLAPGLCFLLLLLAPQASRAQTQAELPASSPALPASPASPASAPAAHAKLHAAIRQAHFTRLQERLETPAEELQQRCRFESDIATAPPAGLVALTFDDGPDPEHTETILAVLAHYGIPATFFFIGEKMQRYPELAAKVLASKQHLVGGHSWSHPNFHDIDEAAQRQEVERSLALLPPDASPALFRYPYGNASCYANELLHGKGYRLVGWHVDSCDWAFDRNGSVDAREALSCGVSSQYRSDFVGHVASALRARRGGIVLMHEIHAHTLAQLPQLIEAIQKEGFRFVRLDDSGLADSLR